jgi:hypothetical protein
MVCSSVQFERFGVQLGFVRGIAGYRGVVLEPRLTSNSRRNLMQGWHWGLIIGLVIAYMIGVKFPGPGQKVFSAVGM